MERNTPNYLASPYLTNILVNDIRKYWQRRGYLNVKVWRETDEQGNWVVRSNIRPTWEL